MSSPHIDGVSLRWRKSTHSSGGGSECVEVADRGDGTAVRDSKDPTGPALAFDRAEWAAFAARVKRGALDL